MTIRRRVTRFAMFGLLAFTLSGAAPASDKPAPDKAPADKEAAAVEASKTWLQLVDQGKYAESWSASAELFRNAVPQNTWVQQLGAARKPLGKVLKRELTSKTFMTSLPGAPDGEYVVIQYATSFENKKSAVETITPMLGKDGVWRVSGYFVR